MIFVGYPKCSTSNKAQKWLDDANVTYVFRHMKDEHPTAEELREWYQKSGLPLKRFFNTSGLLYKSMNIKERLASMTEEEQLQLLASDGMLVKRPIVVDEDYVLVGFREDEWKTKIKK